MYTFPFPLLSFDRDILYWCIEPFVFIFCFSKEYHSVFLGKAACQTKKKDSPTALSFMLNLKERKGTFCLWHTHYIRYHNYYKYSQFLGSCLLHPACRSDWPPNLYQKGIFYNINGTRMNCCGFFAFHCSWSASLD